MAAQPLLSEGTRAADLQTRSFMMMCLSKWLSASLAIVLVAGAAAASDTTLGGKVKSINAEKKTFVLTDTSDKDVTFKFDDDLVINRDGKESKSDLKAGDPVFVGYDKGATTNTAHYILVQEGKCKKCELIQGNIKGYDPDKKELKFTNLSGDSYTFEMGNAPVRLNREDTKADNIKIGDHALLIVDMADGKPVLRSVMIQRAK
jgi:hypothetical protein